MSRRVVICRRLDDQPIGVFGQSAEVCPACGDLMWVDCELAEGTELLCGRCAVMHWASTWCWATGAEVASDVMPEEMQAALEQARCPN